MLELGLRSQAIVLECHGDPNQAPRPLVVCPLWPFQSPVTPAEGHIDTREEICRDVLVFSPPTAVDRNKGANSGFRGRSSSHGMSQNQAKAVDYSIAGRHTWLAAKEIPIEMPDRM